MKRRPAAMALLVYAVAVPTLAGCTEFRTDGGIAGRAADTIMHAPNRQWQTYRAAVFLMLLSATAEAMLADVNSIASFYYAAAAVNSDINNLAGHL